MSKSKRVCIVCWERPPTVPDRERMGSPIKRVCSECHAARLRGDLAYILECERKKAEMRAQDAGESQS